MLLCDLCFNRARSSGDTNATGMSELLVCLVHAALKHTHTTAHNHAAESRHLHAPHHPHTPLPAQGDQCACLNAVYGCLDWATVLCGTRLVSVGCAREQRRTSLNPHTHSWPPSSAGNPQ